MKAFAFRNTLSLGKDVAYINYDCGEHKSVGGSLSDDNRQHYLRLNIEIDIGHVDFKMEICLPKLKT